MTKYLIVPISLALSACLFIWMVYPLYEQAREIKKVEVPKQEKILSKEKEVNKNILSLKENYEIYKDEMILLEEALPQDSDIKSLLVQLEALILESGLVVEEIGLGEGSGEGNSSTNSGAASLVMGAPLQSSISNPEALAVMLDMAGSYENTLLFMEKLESLLRLANIVGVDMTVKEESGNQSQSGDSESDSQEGLQVSQNSFLMESSFNIEFYKQNPIKSESIKQAFEFDQASVGEESIEGNPIMEDAMMSEEPPLPQ